MREIAISFICLAGGMVVSLWALTITLAVTSGKGIYFNLLTAIKASMAFYPGYHRRVPRRTIIPCGLRAPYYRPEEWLSAIPRSALLPGDTSPQI